MSDTPIWNLFAYMNDDDKGEHDERRKIAMWQIPHVVDWAVFRGYDHIYLSRSNETTQFRKAPKPPVTHYGIRGAVDGANEQERTDPGGAAA